MSSSSFYSDSGITTADADAVESSKNAAAQSAQDAAGHASTASEKATEANDSAVAAAASASTANNSNVQAVAINLYSTNTIGTVAGNIADINTVASMESDVDTLANATYKAKVETVADAAYKSDVETVAASGYKSDVETVADATYKAKVETVANGTYKTAVEEVAADLSGSNTIGAAVQSASDAATSASNAAASEASSYTNLQSVIAQAYNISTYAATASGHADDAEDAKTDAQAARDAAQGHRTQTGLDATAAAASATSASNSASAAASSEANAALSEQDAQGYSNAAAGSASTANTNALVAISEATDAADSASTASTASASAVAANTAAQAAKDDAEDAKDAAELAKTAAETAQTNASNYASTASTSASTATTKASEASSSAAAANTSATNAGVSYTNAFNAATDSVNAASTWSSFYTTYLGSYSSPPTTDVQGNPIVTGAFYYDTGAGSNTVGLYVYNGSSWVYSTNYNNVTAPYSLAQDLATNSHDISFGDNAKANFGASDDLQIYHDGNNSYVTDTGTGGLYLRGSNEIALRSSSNENIFLGLTDGSAYVYHNGIVKLQTTSTGIDVTGTVKADTHFTSSDSNATLSTSGTGGTVRLRPNGISSENGQVMVDSSGRVGIGTTSPTAKATVEDADFARLDLNLSNSTGTQIADVRGLVEGTEKWRIGKTASASDDFTIGVGGSERMRINTSGNVGIGTTSPAEKLSIQDGDIIVQNDTKATFGFKGTSASTALAFRDRFAGVDRLTIDASGNVGIGTDSPTGSYTTALHIHGSSTGASLHLTDPTSGATATDGLEVFQYGTDGYIWERETGNLRFGTSATERMRINSSGNVGIGTSSPAGKLEVSSADFDTLYLTRSTAGSATILMKNSSNNGGLVQSLGNGGLSFFSTVSDSSSERMRIDSSGNVGIGGNPAAVTHGPHLDLVGNRGTLTVGTGYFEDNGNTNFIGGARSLAFGSAGSSTERMRIDASGNVGIGETSPKGPLHVYGTEYSYFTSNVANVTPNSTTQGIALGWNKSSGAGESIIAHNKGGGSGGGLVFANNDGGVYREDMRIDSSGNLLVGKTTSASSTAGITLEPAGAVVATRDGGECFIANRKTSDGNIIQLRKDQTTVGSIGARASYLNVGSGDTGLLFNSGQDRIQPESTTGGARDAAIDIGGSSTRFKDLYRSGSTYSTSDRNKKQDIRDLTDAEARVAVVAKSSLKAFRYIDTVEAEGDDANIHFGIIAQDLKAAFEAEGLNADSYQVLKTSTYTDDDGVEQTTYSVCYENLLAFIISAI